MRTRVESPFPETLHRPSHRALPMKEQRAGGFRSPLLLVYSLTIGLGAYLLFWIQPLFAKQALPLLGGSPGVWNTALVFFQATLLAGYLYAHLLSRKLSVRRQVPVHLAVAAAALLALPIAIPEGWTPAAAGEPALWILGMFAVGIGLPFFAVSATSPLLQRWFALAGHPHSGDPYFLYSASNIGSLSALLAFPFLLEPIIGLGEQARLWAWGFGGLLLLLAGSGFMLLRSLRTDAVTVEPPAPISPSLRSPGDREPGGVDRLWWCALAFAPSSLLLGVTTHITTDVAAVPLFWIVPLFLYLATFAIVFARRPILKHEWMVRAQPHAVVLLVVALLVPLGLTINIGIHLVGFFLIAMVCHGELVRRRPNPAYLTEFYLWIAVGGVLGGAFNALAAPHLFDSVLEYPLLIAISCALRPVVDATGVRFIWKDLLWPVLLLAASALTTLAVISVVERPHRLVYVAMIVVLAVVTFSFQRRPVRLALGVGLLLLAYPTSWWATMGDVLAQERSFFGVHTVRSDAAGDYHLLYHGTTIHGAQAIDTDRRREALTYYAAGSPAAEILSTFPFGRVGIVGLGTGSLACHRLPRQQWTYFEIDPVVVRIATASDRFDFVGRCTPDAEIVLGDGRLTLAEWSGPPFDVIVLDAFSSSAIPVHLLTREAIELYFSRLVPDGIVVIHVSNRHLRLAPVLAAAAEELGLVGRYQHHEPERGEGSRYVLGSKWVVLAREERALRTHIVEEAWEPLARQERLRTWTDDYSNILSVLR